MRAIRLLLTASGFITYFIGLMGVSALTTGAMHSAFSARSLPVSVVQD